MRYFAAIGLLVFLFAGCASAFIHHGGGGAAASSSLTTVTVYNSSGSSVSNQPVTMGLGLKLADVPSGSKIQVRKNDGVTVVSTTQEDQISTWKQDGSRKFISLSFTEPDTITTHTSATYQIWAVAGSRNTSANVTTANVVANTNIVLKTTYNLIPSSGQGTVETGVWDFLDVNYVIGNCAQYNGSTGYGADPKCGWEIIETGPQKLGLHLFQYAKRESDNAWQNWLRTDMWVDFTGSGSTPCPCSVIAVTNEPNSWGPITGGTVGGSTMTGYAFGADLYNGANRISSNFGGPNDARTQTVTFDSTWNAFGASGAVTYTGGGWTTKNLSVPGMAMAFTSTGTMPGGVTSGKVYYLWMDGGVTFNNLNFPLYNFQCLCTGQNAVTTNGTGTITATPLSVVTPYTGALLADTTGGPLWISSGGAALATPSVLPAENFTYATQSAHAIPPYITALLGTMPADTNPVVYYPDTDFFAQNMDAGGDDPDDNRIGYIDRLGAISLFSPTDSGAAQSSNTYAAAFMNFHYWHQDEHVGLPPVFNNGSYATLGTAQPTVRVGLQSPPVGWTVPNMSGADQPFSGEAYGPLMEPSHMPAPAQAPYVRTGLPVYQFAMAQEANAEIGGGIEGITQSLAGTTYYRIFNDMFSSSTQTRSVPWGERTLDQAHFFTPDASPISGYLSDLVAGNYAFDVAMVTNVGAGGITTQEASLGYEWLDVRGQHLTADGGYQPWQDDYMFWVYGQEAIRNEFPAAKTFVTTYLYKSVIGKMDANNTYGGGAGCFWAGPVRIVDPFDVPAVGANYDPTTLATTWTSYLTKTTAGGKNLTASMSGTTLSITAQGFGVPNVTSAADPTLPFGIPNGQLLTGTGVPANTILLSGTYPTYTVSGSGATLGSRNMLVSGQANNGLMAQSNAGNPPWTSCGAQSGTLIDDEDGTTGAYPTGLVSIIAQSAAFGAWLSVADSSSLYTSIRTIQYAGTGPHQGGLPLSFTDFFFHSAHWASPAFAIGPPGATQ